MPSPEKHPLARIKESGVPGRVAGEAERRIPNGRRLTPEEREAKRAFREHVGNRVAHHYEKIFEIGASLDVLLERAGVARENPGSIKDVSTALNHAYRQQEERIAQEEGREPNISPEEVLAGIQTNLTTQRATLAEWYSYLEKNPDYPSWFKLLTLKTIIRYTSYDSGTHTFKERGKSDTYQLADFPRLNRRILSDIYNVAIEAKEQKQLDGFSFHKQLTARTESYLAMEKLPLEHLPLHQKPRVFKKGSNPQKLVNFLASAGGPLKKVGAIPETPFPLEWCIAGIGHATSYLAEGGVRVYYSEEKGNYYPRLAVAFWRDGGVREVRGINDRQELEDSLAEDAKTIVGAFKGGADYVRKAKNVQTLSALEKKIRKGEDLNKDELTFLYGLSGPLDGFGYEPVHPKVATLHKGRMPMDDAAIIFSSIAQSPDQITSDTNAYIGPLSDVVWKNILAVESERVGKGDNEKIHVYKDSFPDGKRIRRATILRQTTPKVIKDSLNKSGVAVVGYAGDMIDRIPKEDLDAEGTFELITLQVRDLFTAQELADMHNRVTTKDFLPIANPRTDAEREQNKKVRARHEALGIDLCPATVASNILADEAKEDSARTFPPRHWEYVASETISDRDGNPNVFGVVRRDDGTLELYGNWAGPDRRWALGHELVFRLRK